MKRVLLATAVMLAAVLILLIALPLYAPLLALDGHRDAVFAPGIATRLPGGGVLNRYEYGHVGDPDVVLIHGVPGSAAMMHPLAEALSERGYRVTTYDRAGWAYSSPRPPETLADPENNGRDLLDLVSVLGLRRPVLVGYSYGGGVVQEANRLAPELAACNVLISSIGPGRRRAAASPGLVARVMFSEPLLRWALAVTPIATRAASGSIDALYYPETPGSTEEVHQFLAALEMSIPTWRRELDERYVAFEEFEPQTVTRPTLVMHGEQDRTVQLSVAERLHAALPDSELQVRGDTGHAMVLTHAADLAASIDGFIGRCTR